jgi:uracil-DNA glycosylase family 4
MIDPRELAEHLRLFGEIGVAGVSRDRAWRTRAADEGSDAEADLSPVASAKAGLSPVASAEGDPVTALKDLRVHIGDCTRCKLHGLGRRQVVFGVGNPEADLMFVGEAPGADEDLQGEPFVGRAGQLLTKIIEAIGLKRSDVYIANVIKCRPPGNRNPEPDEVATCEPFLSRQIDVIRPKVIVALGSFAAKALLRSDAPISRIRGHVFDYRGGAKLIPTFHPAFLLRSPERKRDVWEDMKKVRALLADSDSD